MAIPPLKFAKKCPINSYARKNIGYLISMKNRAKIIIETDDDNCPKKKFFDKKKLQHSASEIKNTLLSGPSPNVISGT